MISEITLKFGSNGQNPLKFQPGNMTVIVGPNYSGKSKFIREIHNHVSNGIGAEDDVILGDLKFDKVSETEVDTLIEDITLRPKPGEVLNAGHVLVGGFGNRMQAPRSSLRQAILGADTAPPGHPHRNQAGTWFFRNKTRMLNAEGRIALTNDQSMGDLAGSPQSSFQQLFRSDPLRERVRAIVADAFGKYLVVDPTSGGKLRLRVSSRPPADAEEERSLSERAIEFHDKATLLSEASDGTRAFCGILIEVIAGNPDLLLLDEPEAFLHPGLSYNLGLEMARQVQGSSKNVIVSTHSANFLMGCVASGVNVNVVRLTYQNEVATARLLPARDLRALMREPLLRSANVLSGLFFENVIVCEADSDRAFYQEINHRLNGINCGLRNTVFINANGKDTIPTISKPLKDLGVSVAAIYDLDFIKDGGGKLTKRLNAAHVPVELHDTIRTTKQNLQSILGAKELDYKRHGGKNLLDSDELHLFKALDDNLRDFGIFLVPVGEVEGWLKQLGAKDHGPKWLVEMFEKLGIEDSAEYLEPNVEEDVWAFLESISKRMRPQ